MSTGEWIRAGRAARGWTQGQFGKQVALLEEAARQLYREWFVRLRFPGHKHTPIIDGVPEGWGAEVLSDLCEEVREGVQPDTLEADTPHVGLEHMPRRSISLSEWGSPEQVTSSKHRFREGEILFGKIRPYFHKVGIAPEAFTDAVFPWFADVIAAIAYDPSPLLLQYRDDRSARMAGVTRERGKPWSGHPIFEALDAGMRAFADRSPDRFEAFVNQWRGSDLNSVHFFMLEGLKQLAVSRAAFVLDYIVEDARRFAIGSLDDRHSGSRRLIGALVPNLTREEALRLERALLAYTYYRVDADQGEQRERFERRKWAREHRLRLLRSFPADRLSPEGRKLLNEEQRAFPRLVEKDVTWSGVHTVGSRMSSTQMQKASRKQLANLFEELPDQTGWDHPRRRWDFIGGSIQASREFAKFAAEEPEGALDVIRDFRPGEHERPAACALEEMAKAGRIETQGLYELVTDLVSRGFGTQEFRTEVARAFEHLARSHKGGLPDEVCRMLRGWLRDVEPLPAPDAADESGDNDETRSLLWGMRGGGILPQGNYTVLQTLEAGFLFREQPDYDHWLDVLEEHLGRTEDPRMWKSMTPELRFLANAAHGRSEALVDRLFGAYPSSLQSWEGAYLLAHAHGWVSPDLFRVWMETLRDGIWKEGAQAFGELLVLARVLHSDWEWVRMEIAEVLAGEAGPASKEHGIRVGAAYAAGNLWHELEDRSVCTEIFLGLLRHEDGAAGKALADFFRHAEKLPHGKETETILDAMIANPWFFRCSPDFFLGEMLENHVGADPERVHELSNVIVDQWAERLRDFSTSGPLHAEKLVHVAITLQRIHGYREKGLALFERLLELEAYGAREALRDIDVDRWAM